MIPKAENQQVIELLNSMFELQPYQFRRLIDGLKDTNVLSVVENLENQSILSIACCINRTSDITIYNFAYKKFDMIFWSVMKPFENHIYLLDKRDVFGRSAIASCVYNRHAHYFYALLNYGLKLTNSDFLNAHVLALKCKNDEHRCNTMMLFVKSLLIHKVMESDYPNGQKLLALGKTCLITQKSLERATIIEDGTVYSYNALKEYVLKNGMISPINGVSISRYVYLFMEDRFEVL